MEPLWIAMFEHHRDHAPDDLKQVAPFREGPAAWELRRQHHTRWLQDDPDARLFLAIDDEDRVVGDAFTRVDDAQASVVTSRIGVLESLAVLPDHRGSGVRSALVARSIESFRSLGRR